MSPFWSIRSGGNQRMPQKEHTDHGLLVFRAQLNIYIYAPICGICAQIGGMLLEPSYVKEAYRYPVQACNAPLLTTWKR